MLKAHCVPVVEFGGLGGSGMKDGSEAGSSAEYLGLGTQGRARSLDSQTEWYPLCLLLITAVGLQELAALSWTADGKAEAQQTHPVHSREEPCASRQLTQLGGGGEYCRPTAQDRDTSICWRLLGMHRQAECPVEGACLCPVFTDPLQH